MSHITVTFDFLWAVSFKWWIAFFAFHWVQKSTTNGHVTPAILTQISFSDRKWDFPRFTSNKNSSCAYE